MNQDQSDKYISELIGMELSEVKKLADEATGDDPLMKNLRVYFNMIGENVGALKSVLNLPKLGVNKEFDIKSMRLASDLASKALKESEGTMVDLEELAGKVANQIIEELCKDFYGKDIFTNSKLN